MQKTLIQSCQKHWRILPIVIAVCLTLFCSVTTLPAAEAEEDEQSFIHFRLTQNSKQGGKPATTDHGEHTQPTFTPAQTYRLQENVKALLKERLARNNGKLTTQDAADIYKAGEHFSIIHGLLGNGIDAGLSAQLGQARQQLHEQALKTAMQNLQGKTPKLGINDFGSGADMSKVNAKTDIDFTLYPNVDGLEGHILINEYNKAFKNLTGVDPGQMDIVAHRYEATIPDWRQSHSSADFLVKIRQGRQLLKANPEAYFLEGAYVQQIMGRSTKEGARTFRWLKMDKDGPRFGPPANAALERQFFYKPEIKARHAFGGAVGNRLFWYSHKGDMAAQAKYLLRSMDDGVDLLLSTEEKIRLKPWDTSDLPAQIRRDLVDHLYGHYPDHLRNELWMALETCRNIRKLKDAKQAITPETSMRETYIRYHRQLMGEVQFRDENQLIDQALRSYQRASQVILLENVARSAQPRLTDWLAPDIREKVPVFNKNSGAYESVQPTADHIKKLQFSAFYELRDAIEVMEPGTVARIKRQNPNFNNEITLLEKLIKKQREMMLQPDIDQPLDLMQRRRKAAEEVVDAFDQLAASNKSRSVLGYIRDGWAAGQALETYMQGRMVDALVHTGGQRYGMLLENLRLQTKPVNEQIMSPVWMARIGKANSVINILTVYARKGEVDAEVAWVALREGISYLPVIGMAADIKSGGATAIYQIVLTQTVPGYAPVLLVINSATGVARLGGEAIFSPLKKDKILMAYLGYLPKKSSGLFTSGRSERIWLPRKGLLHWVDPEGKLPMEEKRKRFFLWFRPRLAQVFTQKWGETPEQYLEDTKSGGENAIWATEEGRYLQMYVQKYIHDWWEGTGEFSADADVVVHSMMEEHFSPEIKGELEQLLIGDYLTGKKLYAQEQEETQQGLLKTISQAAHTSNEMQTRYQAEESAHLQAMDVVGDAVIGQVLDQAPQIENGIEITAAPYVALKKGKDGKDIYAVESLNLHTKVTAPSTDEHPAPFAVRFEVQAGKKAETDAVQQTKVEMETEADRVTVVAKVYDANHRFYFQESIDFDVIRQTLEKQADEEALNKLMDELQALALKVESTASLVSRFCQEAEALIGLVRAGVTEIRSVAEQVKAQVEALKPDVLERSRLALEVRKLHQQAEASTTKAGELASQMEKLSEQLCREAKQLQGQKALTESDKQARLEQLEKMNQWLHVIQTEMAALITNVDQASETAVQDANAMENQETKFASLREAMDLIQRLREMNRQLDIALDNCHTADGHLKELEQLQKQFLESYSATEKIVSCIEHVENRKTYQNRLTALREQVDRVVADVIRCPEQARGQVQPLRESLTALEPLAREADSVRAEMLRKPGMRGDAVGTAAEKAELCDFLLSMAQGYAARAQKLSEDGRFCSDLAGNLIERPATVAVPDIVGRTLEQAKRLLAARGLKLRQLKGAKAPNVEMGDTVASQSPQPGEEVAGGAEITAQIYEPLTRQEQLSRVDCNKYPNTEARYDPKSGKVDCICISGFTLNTAKGGCISCRTQQTEFQGAISRQQWEKAENALAPSANCSFYGAALAQLQTAQQRARNSDCQRLQNLYWQAMDSKNYQQAQQVLNQATSCDFYQRANDFLIASLRHEREMYCLDFESRIMKTLSQNDLAGAQQLLDQAIQNGCRISQRTLDIVQRAAQNQRRRDQTQLWTALITGMAQAVNNMNNSGSQPPPQPPPRPGGGSYGGTTTTVRPPTSGGTTGNTGGGGGSKTDCEKKYCPICGDDDVDLLGVSADNQCMECRRVNKAKIEACMRGDQSGSGNTYQSFRTYSVVQCEHRYWDAARKVYKLNYTYHIYGGPYAYPSKGKCPIVYRNHTETECHFEKGRLEEIERKRKK